MLFVSEGFIFLFLPIFLTVYYIVPIKFKNLILFVGSLVFYACGEWKYLPLILISLVLNYIAAIVIGAYQMSEDSDGKSTKNCQRISLIVILVYDFAMLFVFKYFTFFTGIESDITLPLGISFYTFQIVSYVIDVYRRDIKSEINFISLGVYLCMFPQLIAGPIVLYSDISRQIKRRKIKMENIEDGIKTFILGMGVKMIIADVLGTLWTHATVVGFDAISTPLAWMSMFAYTFQIYFDFYGYSLMAIGLGKMLGFTIPQNFNNPYVSRSATEFWRRWHITLGRWFREYLYIPIGGNRKGKIRTVINLFIVWGLTGLWHGAGWNFVLWGLTFAVLLTIEKLGFSRILDRFKVLSHIYMILVIPMSWMIFVIDKMSDIGEFFGRLFPIFGSAAYVNQGDWLEQIPKYIVFFVLAIIFSFEFPQKLYRKYKKTMVVTVILLVIFVYSVYRIATAASNPFLYFRF